MGIKKIKISHQRKGCIGCGSCAQIAPQCWRMNDEDGQSDLIGGKTNPNGVVTAEIDESDYEENKKAADACPVHIIRLD